MRKPDYQGAAKVWRIDQASVEAKRKGEHHASVATFLVHGPFHPFWTHWLVTVVHLRTLPDERKPAFKKSPEMTHEFIILSLDPGKPEAPNTFDPDNLDFPIKFMTPPDAVVQFKVDSDAKAADICQKAVELIAAGHASPDSDYRKFWERMIPGTANCTKHPDKGLH
jgi:hypothetical protein